MLRNADNGVSFVTGCPYKKLTEGNVDDRLKTSDDRCLLLDFLITELLAARILSVKKPKDNIELTLVCIL